MGFWIHILQQPEDSIVKNAYKVLHELDRRGKNNWVTCIRNLLISGNDVSLRFLWENHGARNMTKFKIEKYKATLEKNLSKRFENKIKAEINNPLAKKTKG